MKNKISKAFHGFSFTQAAYETDGGTGESLLVYKLLPYLHDDLDFPGNVNGNRCNGNRSGSRLKPFADADEGNVLRNAYSAGKQFQLGAVSKKVTAIP